MTGPITDVLAWLVVAALTGSVLLESRNRRAGRTLSATGWVLFAAFWALLVPHFAIEQRSIVEGAGALVAVPASLVVGYLLWSGRDSLFALSRAVGIMGLVYLPFITIPALAEMLIETVTAQSYLVMVTLGYSPTVVHGEAGYWNTFQIVGPAGYRHTLHVILACTGIGSMSIMTGLISAVKAPVRRRLYTIAVVIPTIWVLNLVRVTFITISFGHQWFQVFVEPTMELVGYTNPYMVSYFIADRVLAQSLSAVALLILIWFVARELPGLLSIVEEILYVFTNREYDLRASDQA